MPEETPRRKRDGKRRARFLPVLLLAALVIVPRALSAVTTSEEFWSRGDMNWNEMAVCLLDGEGLLIPAVGPLNTPMYAHKTPVFALILAGIYGTVGRDTTAVVIVQILFALAATAAVYALGRRITGSAAAGYVAAVITALHPPLVLHDVQLMETTLYRGLVALLTLLVFNAGESPRIRDLALVGAVAALTVLTRTTVLFFLPFAAIWFLVRWRGRWRRYLPGAAVGIVVFLAVLSPWLIRNALLFGRVHLVTGGGRSFWIASSAEFLEVFPETSVDVIELRLLRALPRSVRKPLRSVDELEVDRVLMERALADLREHPGRVVDLALRKTGAAFSPILNPRHEKDALDRRAGDLKARIHVLSYGPLLIVGALGLLLLLARRPAAAALVLLQVLAFTVFTVIFWSHSRHRYFLDQFFAIGAAYLLWTLAAWWRARRELTRPAGAEEGLRGS